MVVGMVKKNNLVEGMVSFRLYQDVFVTASLTSQLGA
jgi:hypothetical protein